MNRLERWLAPGILAGVALIQFGLSNLLHLTPWKGGGFGMFSTIDSLGSRVVSCEGVTTGGREIRIDAGLAFSGEEWDNARSLPSRRALEAMARRLLVMELVKESVRLDAAVARFRAENPDVKWEAGALPTTGLYRPLRASDPEFDQLEIVELKEVRLRWWRLIFDQKESQFRTVPLGDPVVRARPS